MASAAKDKVKGVFQQVKGRAKELAGKATDNPKLELKGVVEKNKGKAQRKLGQVKTVFAR